MKCVEILASIIEAHSNGHMAVPQQHHIGKETCGTAVHTARGWMVPNKWAANAGRYPAGAVARCGLNRSNDVGILLEDSSTTHEPTTLRFPLINAAAA